MTYLIYLFFGVMPSIIWLLFYLRKDAHPESNPMVLKIFFYGMLTALPAILLELGFLEQIEFFNLSPVIASFLSIFVGVALAEEFLKYLVVQEKVFSHPEFDEPVDTMLYMIISALGFAASENILILFSLGPAFLIGQTVAVSAFRFLGATFLHALCSGLLGFFLALSFWHKKNRTMFFALGLGISTILHGLYNFSIIKIEGNLKFLIPSLILLALAVFVAFGFQKVKKIKSTCKIN